MNSNPSDTVILPDVNSIGQSKRYDAQEVRRAVRDLLGGGSNGAAAELRAYPRRKRSTSGGSTWTTYITPDAPTDYANDFCQQHNGLYHLWFSPNSVIIPCGKKPNEAFRANVGNCTSDEFVPKRSFLPVDVDPVKPKAYQHQPATNEESAAAGRLTDEIVTAMRTNGWPDPYRLHSGNGRQLFYSIDLPNDSESTLFIKSVLRKLDKDFSNEFAIIDTSVFNASRMMRTPGTLNCKGNDTEERPWRMAHFEDVQP